ncbi:ABC transporter ATP-binding protein [Permianibacter sp. IMCC34836]|uniref:ABC transporter ATP-binding protein n=1 Tax=Permianibacter fluminis TaxID=2738515 RepID=UPI001554DF54|nr:ABC transporter ATP-binding protein [Permianibacter fluminis]NQD38790.1 ABC transporter ATP-binding protein [Permianibacter fluminis]
MTSSPAIARTSRHGDTVIDVSGLQKRFAERTAVQAMSLHIRRGEIFGFLGPNGSGKTTTLRMLCGLLTPDEGVGSCLGFDIRQQSAEIKRRVGYMTQRFSLYEDLTVAENLQFVADVYGMDRISERVNETLHRIGLADRAKQLAGTLSGGWKQRLALAACLLHQPELLLLDEPTAAVDPNARREFWEQIHLLSAEGITVLVSTHYMDEAERCHRLAYISAGVLLADGSPEELVQRFGQPTWEMQSPPDVRLLSEIRCLPGVSQVAPFGNLLHVCAADAALAEPAITQFATTHALALKLTKARLEDVFIALQRQSEQRPPEQRQSQTLPTERT